MSQTPHWLDLTEYVAIAVTIIGAIAAIFTGSWNYAIIPLTLSLGLNLLNRYRLDQSIRRRINNLTKNQQEIQLQISALQQDIINANDNAKILVKQTLAHQKPPIITDLDSGKPIDFQNFYNQYTIQQKIIESWQKHTNRLEETLTQLIDMWSSSGVLERIEYLEKNFVEINPSLADNPPLILAQKEDAELTLPQPELSNIELANLDALLDLVSGDLKSGDLWETSNWQVYNDIVAHSEELTQLEFTIDGNMLISASRDQTVKIWRSIGGFPLIYDLTAKSSSAIKHLAIDRQKSILLTINADQQLQSWSIETGELRSEYTDSFPEITQLKLTSKDLITIDRNGQLSFYQLEPFTLRQQLEDQQSINDLVVNEQRDICITNNQDNTIKIWRISNPELINYLENNQQQISSFATNPSGEILALGGTNGQVVLWHLGQENTAENKLVPLQTINAHQGRVNTCIFTEDNEHLITGGSDGKTCVWYRASSLLLREKATTILVNDRLLPVMAIAIHPYQQLIAVGYADGTIQIWKDQ